MGQTSPLLSTCAINPVDKNNNSDDNNNDENSDSSEWEED